MEVTIAIKAAEMRSVPRFCAIQSNMKITPLKREGITELLYLRGELRGFLIRLEEHVDDACKQDHADDHTEDIGMAGEEAAELVDHEGDDIRKAALIADGEPGPLRAVHLALDGADGREARSAQQVEHEEGVAGDAGEGVHQVLIDRSVAAAIENAKRADNVLLGNEAGDGGDSRLPVAPAEGLEDPGDHAADGCEDGVVDLALVEHTERAVNHTEVGGEPDKDGGQQDDRTGLLDEGPAALPHAAQDVAEGRPVVGRQLHDKRSRITGEHLGLFQHDAGDDDGSHADEVSGGGDPGAAAEERARDHADERDLCAAGDKGRGHDRHTAVAFIFNGTRGHDTRNAAADADEHRDEGLAGQAELAEDTVENEGDTGHVAAGFEEGQHQEQNEHLRHEAEDRADTGDDAVEDQAVQPAVLRDVAGIQQVFDQNGNAGDPHAVVGGIRLVKAVLFEVADGVHIGHLDNIVHLASTLGQRVIVNGHVVDGEGLLVLNADGRAGGIRRDGLHLSQSSVGVEVFRFGVKLIVAADCFACGGVFVRSVVVGGGADAEQVPAVAEQAVVGPVGRRRADGDHGDVVNKEHDDCEDGQAQPAVGDDPVDLIGGGELFLALLLVAALDDLRDVDIALVGDDGLRVVVQLLFGGLDVLFDVLHRLCRDAQLLENLVVALKDLDRVPALLLGGLVVQDGFLDMGDGVLNSAGEGVLRLGVRALCRGDRGLRRVHDAGALQSGDLNDLAAQLTGQLLDVDLVAVLLDDIHHVDGDDDRDAQLGQLRGEVEVALEVGAVDDVQDGIRALRDQIVTGDDFLQRVRRKGIDTGKVHDDDVLMLLKPAFLLLDGDAGPVANELVRARQGVEQRCFAAVRIAREGNFDLLFHFLLLPVQEL